MRIDARVIFDRGSLTSSYDFDGPKWSHILQDSPLDFLYSFFSMGVGWCEEWDRKLLTSDRLWIVFIILA